MRTTHFQQMDTWQGSVRSQEDSTILVWSCSPWDSRAARLALWHPQGERSSNDFSGSTSPPTSVPHPKQTLPPPQALALPQLQAPLLLHGAGSCETLFFPATMCMIFLFESFLSPKDNLKHFRLFLQRSGETASPTIHTGKLWNPPSPPPPSPDSRAFGLLSWRYIYLTFTEYAICHAKNFKKHLTLSVSNCNFPHCLPSSAQYHPEMLQLLVQLNHKKQLYE